MTFEYDENILTRKYKLYTSYAVKCQYVTLKIWVFERVCFSEQNSF